MAQRSVVVRLMAQVGDYVSNMGKAKSSTDQLAQAQEKASQSTDKTSESTRKTSAELTAQAAAAQKSANALGLQYNASGQLADANGKVLTSAQAAAQGMDKFSDAVYLTADAAEDAGASSEKAASGFSKLAASADENRDSWDRAGGALVAFGVGAVAALGATAKAAMDWESAWAGVMKTIDGSPEEMAELEGGLRDLAKTLPIAHTEIAGVAEAAGQLGVARKDVLGFTKTMIDLGVSTNLTAEDAATNIAQISNVMGTMTREGSLGVARFGSALVALGNDGASTEAEILAMAQRIAGAGATVGMTEVEVLALSNTLASMGVQAELGGGVTTRVMLKMYDAVQSGGSALQAFATTAGVSMAEFSAAFQDSPVKAMDLVAQGLFRIKEEGGNVVDAMSEMGIKGTQEVQVMLALANSGTLLTDSLKVGTQAWEENVALVEEATKRYDTAESRIRIAWNNIVDAAISAGAVLLPIISNMADGISNLAGFFGDLPAPVQGALTIIGGLVGVAALLAGGFLTLFPRIMDVVGAFKTLNASGGNVGGKMKTLGKALGFASIALAAASALKMLNNSMQPAVDSTEELAQALLRLKDNSGALDDIFSGIEPGTGGAVLKDINNIGDALARIEGNGFKDSFGKFGNDVLGLDNDFSKLDGTISNLDLSMAGMVGSGNFEAAARGFKSVAESADAQGISLETVGTYFPGYLDSLRALAKEQGVAVSEAEVLAWAMGEVPQSMLDAAAATEDAAASAEEVAAANEAAAAASEEFIEAMAELGLTTDGTIASLDKYTDALLSAGLSTMSSRDAAFAWQETLRGVGAQIEEVGWGVNATGTDFDLLTEAGKNANSVFQGLVSEGMSVASTFGKDMSKSAADVNIQLQGTYDAGVAAAIGLGLGEDAAIALTREVMGIPEGVAIETWMSEQALMMAGQTGDAVKDIPPHVAVQTSMDSAAFNTAGDTKKAVDDVPNQTVIDSWMSDEAFVEAIRTRAAAEGVPPDVAIDSFMQSAARNEADDTTSAMLRIPKGASISSFMQEYARLEAERLKAALDNVDGRTVNTYAFHHSTQINEIINRRAREVDTGASDAGYSSGGGVGGLAQGGRVADFIGGFPGGGRVPGARSANILNDNVLASVNGQYMGLQGTEWVINPRSSGEYDEELESINNGSFPKGLLSRALNAGGREWTAPQGASALGAASAVEKHYHTHVSASPGLEQSYARTIADQAVQRQRDIQLAHGID